MKLVCVKNNMPDCCHLTIGKIYNVVEIDTDAEYYRVPNDNNDNCWYYQDKFVTLEKNRKQKLNKINSL